MGLSFLDVLCCGLGSAVLLFLIVKHEGTSSAQSTATPSLTSLLSGQRVEQASLVQRLAALREVTQELAEQAVTAEARLRENRAQSDTSASVVDRYLELMRRLAALRSQSEQLKRELDRRRAVAARPTPPAPSTPPDPAPLPKVGAVEGISLANTDKVVVLLDVSDSMLHRSLVEIVRLRASSTNAQKRAYKWTQATNITRWAFTSISPRQRFKLLVFSEGVTDLNLGAAAKRGMQWDVKSGDSSESSRVSERIMTLTPERGTDLSKALEVVSSLTPRAAKILIITDGLPNQMNATGIKPSLMTKRNCYSRTGVTTGACRQFLAIDTINHFSDRLTGTEINVILLPLDGDSEALRFYSLVTGSSGGRLLTPASDWLRP
jgi:hypothetical protein